MSLRSVLHRFPHPTNPNLVILALDDGYPIVLTRFNAIGIHIFDIVRVSGPVKEIEGVKSYGDFAEPIEFNPGNILSKSRDLGCSLSAAFSGKQFTEMTGISITKADFVQQKDALIDATLVVIGPEEEWVAFAGSKAEMFCFDSSDNLIRPRIGEHRIWSRLSILDNLYTFCGILRRSNDGGPSSFEIHCIWNRILCEPVGPPFDRRVADFLGIPFARKVDIPRDLKGDGKIMVRVDNHTPLLI